MRVFSDPPPGVYILPDEDNCTRVQTMLLSFCLFIGLAVVLSINGLAIVCLSVCLSVITSID